MHRSFVIGIAAGLATTLAVAEARAGVWAWGCSGPAGPGHLLFNRLQLLRPVKAVPPASLFDLVLRDDMRSDRLFAGTATADAPVWEADDVNSGFDTRMVFERTGPAKDTVILTETGSKTLSSRTIPGCRDETRTHYRKTYRVEHGTETPLSVTLDCWEYTLSTRGGRCTSDD